MAHLAPFVAHPNVQPGQNLGDPFGPWTGFVVSPGPMSRRQVIPWLPRSSRHSGPL